MRFLLTLSLVVSSLVFSVNAQRTRKTPVRKIPRGETVVRTDPQPQASPPKAAEKSPGAVVEKFVANYEVNADGTGTEVRELQQRCSTEICVYEASTFRQVFNRDLQKLRVLEAYILKADNTRVNVTPNGITDRATDQAEAAPGFSSMRQLEVKFPEGKPGDAFYLKLETTTIKPHFQRRFDALELFPLVYDWKSIDINVSAPAELQLFTETTGLEGGRLADEDGRARWQFKKLNLTRLELEPGMFDIASISPRFALTTYRDANALGAVFWESAKSKTVVTPELQTLADEITKGASTESAQASAIYDWVNKNIRYLSVIMDRGGWVPHSASEIIKNGYGDCKDYTIIIHTLLKAKGIESTPVLIRSDLGDWFPSVPTADFFNHLILYIPSLNVFADATTPDTRLGLVPQTLVGKFGILAGEKTGVIQLPKDNPADNQILSEMTIDFSDNGSIKTRSKNTYIGRSEILFRPVFSSSFIKQESEMFVRLMLSYFGLNGEGRIVGLSKPHDVGEPFNVELETRINNLTTFAPKGKVEVPQGLNMLSAASTTALISTESRKTSLVVGAMKMRENIVVNLPAGMKILSGPTQASHSNAVGSFHVTPELKDGSLRYVREIVISKDVIEAKDYPLLKELVTKMLIASDLIFEYSADPSSLAAKSKPVRSTPPKTTKVERWDPLRNPDGFRPQKLTPADVRRLEKKLATTPDDVMSRITLIQHYSLFAPRITPSMETAHIQHRVWLINNHPEIDEMTIYGVTPPQLSPSSVDLLKKAWLSKLEQEKSPTELRSHAIDSLRPYATEVASDLAEQNAKLAPEDYNAFLLVAIINSESLTKEPTGAKADRAAGKVLEYGKPALALLKKQRSDERDNARTGLLINLCAAALHAGDLDGAKAFAEELVLDFGQTSAAATYDEVSHVGNTTLGLVEARRNNIPKAREHLLASIRAPLRHGYNSLPRIDTRLARELYEKGEKATVQEFLKLSLELENFKVYPESYADDIKAIKLWLDQISKGIKPSFEFKTQ